MQRAVCKVTNKNQTNVVEWTFKVAENRNTLIFINKFFFSSDFWKKRSFVLVCVSAYFQNFLGEKLIWQMRNQ